MPKKVRQKIKRKKTTKKRKRSMPIFKKRQRKWAGAQAGRKKQVRRSRTRIEKHLAAEERLKGKKTLGKAGLTSAEETYTAEKITVLRGLEPVRRRPAMYIGGTGEDGLHHLIWEVVDNSIDEAMAGYCSEIKVSLLKDNKVMIEDNGRGIPVEMHKATRKSALETVMCTLHAGAKFDERSYKVAGGLHGVGVSVVNALSRWMRVEVCRGGWLYAQEYSRGKPKTKVRKIKKIRRRGTKVFFEPDPEIFKKIEFSWKKILTHLRQQAYLTKGVKIVICDEREINGLPKHLSRCYTFYFEGGVLSYVKYLNRGEKLIHPTPFYIEKEINGASLEAAFQYTDEIKGFEVSFANNIHTGEGGTHLMGFRSALTRTINDFARKQGFIKEKEENLSGEDVREGLTSVISVKLRNPQFEGQTKAKLGNAEIRPLVSSVLSLAISEFLESHPQDARLIIEKCLLAAKARQAAKAAKETVIRKGLMEGLTLPGKLADCSTRKPEEAELFIVEGDSAGGSCKQARNRQFQAVLPLRGKILNVERVRLDKMLVSKEIKAMIIALGTGVGDDFDISKLRYHRIVITCDADTDGNHIRTLLLTFFYRYFPQIIEQGYLYIAQPPLYRISQDKKIYYAYTEDEKEKILKDLLSMRKELRAKKRKTGVEKLGFRKKILAGKEKVEEEEIKAEKIPGLSIQRYKGLGEMNPDQLWETTMNPQNRTMKQVTIEDIEKTDEIFDILMGDDVEPRRRFIQTFAKQVRNLDI